MQLKTNPRYPWGIPLDTCKLLVKGILWFWVSGLCGIFHHRSVNIFSGLANFFCPGTCYPQDGYLNCQVGFNWSNHLYRAQKRMFGDVLCLCEFLKHLSWHSSRTTELEDPTNLDLKQFCWSRDFRWLLVHGWIYGSIHLPTIHSVLAGNPSAATLQWPGAWDCDHPIAYSTCTPNSIMVFPPEIQHSHEIHEKWPSLSSMTESIKPYFPHCFPCFPLFSPCFSGHLMAAHGKTSENQAAPVLHAAEEQRRAEVPVEPLPKCRGRSSRL